MSTTSSFLESLRWDKAGHFWLSPEGIEVHPKQLLKLTIALVEESDAIHTAQWEMEDTMPSFRKALAAFEKYFDRQARKAGL